MDTINKTRDQICNHLRFLGYAVDLVEIDNTENIRAQHPEKIDLFIVVADNRIMFKSVVNCTDMAERDRLGFLEYINMANKNVFVSKYATYDTSSYLLILAYYFLEYRQVEFGRFLELWNQDFQLFLQVPNGIKYIK